MSTQRKGLNTANLENYSNRVLLKIILWLILTSNDLRSYFEAATVKKIQVRQLSCLPYHRLHPWAKQKTQLPYARHYKPRLVYFYPISKDHFFVFKEVFSENSILAFKSGL